MTNSVMPISIPEAFFWQKNIYYIQEMVKPANILDCMNECINVQAPEPSS
jgi:hypothetical protein